MSESKQRRPSTLNTNCDQFLKPNPEIRRKSTLSANGFFIDYSCTRRRSSSMRHDKNVLQSEEDGARNLSKNLLNAFVSPVRYRASFAGAPSRDSHTQREGNQSHLLSPMNMPLAAAALAGSRKTSIFDPTGHSLAAPLNIQKRRKSTMVTGRHLSSRSIENKPKSPNALNSTFFRHTQLSTDQVKQVPVIGCSPTSIRASLAVLEENQRQQKLLKKLREHNEKKEMRERTRFMQNQIYSQHTGPQMFSGEQMHAYQNPPQHTLDGIEDELPVATRFRRKSLRAVKDAVQLISNVASGRRDSRATSDGLSVSSMSLSYASSNSNDDFSSNFPPTDAKSFEAHLSEQKELYNQTCRKQSNNFGPSKQMPTKFDAISRKMSHLSNYERRPTQANFSISPSGSKLDYWYYYNYLSESSFDVIDELPITSVKEISDSERKRRIQVNFSLARLEILNAKDNNEPEIENASPESRKYSTVSTASTFKLDYSHATDVSMDLSSASASSDDEDEMLSENDDATQFACYGCGNSDARDDKLSVGVHKPESCNNSDIHHGSISSSLSDTEVNRKTRSNMKLNSNLNVFQSSRSFNNSENKCHSSYALQVIGNQENFPEQRSASFSVYNNESRKAREKAQHLRDLQKAITSNNELNNPTDDFERFKQKYRGYERLRKMQEEERLARERDKLGCKEMQINSSGHLNKESDIKRKSGLLTNSFDFENNRTKLSRDLRRVGSCKATPTKRSSFRLKRNANYRNEVTGLKDTGTQSSLEPTCNAVMRNAHSAQCLSYIKSFESSKQKFRPEADNYCRENALQTESINEQINLNLKDHQVVTDRSSQLAAIKYPRRLPSYSDLRQDDERAHNKIQIEKPPDIHTKLHQTRSANHELRPMRVRSTIDVNEENHWTNRRRSLTSRSLRVYRTYDTEQRKNQPIGKWIVWIMY